MLQFHVCGGGRALRTVLPAASSRAAVDDDDDNNNDDNSRQAAMFGSGSGGGSVDGGSSLSSSSSGSDSYDNCDCSLGSFRQMTSDNANRRAPSVSSLLSHIANGSQVGAATLLWEWNRADLMRR